MWNQINFEKQYGLVTQAVTYPNNSQPHIGKPKTERSARTVLLPTPLVEILKPCAKESGVSSAIVADLMGHADTRMVETVYARTRHEGVMKNLVLLERLNAL